MKRWLSRFLMALIGLLVVGVWTPSETAASDPCASSNLQRLSAEFQFFDDLEASTFVTIPGIHLYDKTVFVPDGCNILYVTVSGSTSTNNGSQLLLSCEIDSLLCNGGLAKDANAPGWIV